MSAENPLSLWVRANTYPFPFSSIRERARVRVIPLAYQTVTTASAQTAASDLPDIRRPGNLDGVLHALVRRTPLRMHPQSAVRRLSLVSRESETRSVR